VCVSEGWADQLPTAEWALSLSLLSLSLSLSHTIQTRHTVPTLVVAMAFWDSERQGGSPLSRAGC
jgi:hypothetical protein